MGSNSELTALKSNAVKQRIIDGAFLVFSKQGIESVKMTDVAESAGVGVATVYRYFGTKNDLVLAVGVRAWDEYISKTVKAYDRSLTALESFGFYLESFLDLYRDHKDLLRFNQFFNVYIRSGQLDRGSMGAYIGVIEALGARFHNLYQRAIEDRTMRTDVPEAEVFSTTLHLMLAAVTRYAVGLVYQGGSDPIQELTLLKQMLMREYASAE